MTGWKQPACYTDQKVDFPSFREGWGIPPGGRNKKAHYMVRRELTNNVWSICGRINTAINHHGSGLCALWKQGSFPRCKTCETMRRRR